MRIQVNSLGWTKSEKESFKSSLSDMAREFKCSIRVLDGIDNSGKMVVETDDESVVFMLTDQGLA